MLYTWTILEVLDLHYLSLVLGVIGSLAALVLPIVKLFGETRSNSERIAVIEKRMQNYEETFNKRNEELNREIIEIRLLAKDIKNIEKSIEDLKQLIMSKL